MSKVIVELEKVHVEPEKVYDVIEINKKTYHHRKKKIFENNGKLCGFITNDKFIIYKNDSNDFETDIKKINEKYLKSKQSILNKNNNF